MPVCDPEVPVYVGATGAGRLLSVSDRAVRKLVDSGALEPVQRHGPLLLRRADVERLARDRAVSASARAQDGLEGAGEASGHPRAAEAALTAAQGSAPAREGVASWR